MRLACLLLLTSLISFQATGQSDHGLRFIENKGQWREDTDFQASIPGGRLGVSARGFSVLLLDRTEIDRRHMARHEGIRESDGLGVEEPINGHYFQINLVGSNPQSRAVPGGRKDGYYNYFLGNDARHWTQRAEAFSSILYPEVYPGVDFRVSSVGPNLKYDFIVRPGADPSQIRIEYRDTYGVDRSGDDLEIKTAVGSLKELKPYSYQADGQRQQPVPSEYKLAGNIMSFVFPEGYDDGRTLVIDPLLIFSTYSGSTADNWGSTATPGEHGTLYSAGVTYEFLGGVFPATTGAFQTGNGGPANKFDMAIIKYDSAGSKFLYATYLGGLNNDTPQSLVVDEASGDLIVLGISSSPDYPVSANAFDPSFNGGVTIFNGVLDSNDEWDIVLTRLSPDGDQLVGSTYLGGSGNDGLNVPPTPGGPVVLVANYGDEMRGDVITDQTGHVYISSVTASGDFPIVQGHGFDNSLGGTTDGLLAKMAPDLSALVWTSYIGGSGFDAAYSIKFDDQNNIIMAGGTTSADFPITAGVYQATLRGGVDGWIARVAADGSAIMNATFTGTAAFDQVYFVDLNSSGHIFVYGQTTGQMPVTAGVYHNSNSGQFLQRLSADLHTLEFSTVFGSGLTRGQIIPNISPTAFMVNDCNSIYMAGWGGAINSSTGFWQSTTRNMPVTADAYQKTTAGSDFYFIVLNGNATQLVYSTYMGGNMSGTHVDGGTSRFDKHGIVYHAVCAGCGGVSDFPTTSNAQSRLNGSPNCNNAAFKFDLSMLKAVFNTNNEALTMPGYNNVCYPDPIVFENFSTGGKIITWDFDDGTTLNLTNADPANVTHRYQQAGQYHVKLKITDLNTCSQKDSVTRVINYFKANVQVGDDAVVCEGASFQLTASGGVTYTWTSKDGTFTSTQPAPIIQPTGPMTYYISVLDADGCTRKDTLAVTINWDVRAAFEVYDANLNNPGYDNVCFPELMKFQNLSINGESYTWDFDDGTAPLQTQDTAPLAHGFTQQGVYTVRLTAANPTTCNKFAHAAKTLHYFKAQIVVTDDSEICQDTQVQLSATGGSSYTWTADDQSLHSSSPSPRVQPAVDTRYFLTATDARGCVAKDTVAVTVIHRVKPLWEHTLIGNCQDRPSVTVRNLTPPEDDLSIFFDFGDGTTATDNEVTHIYEKDGTYTVRITTQKKVCIAEEAVEFPIYKLTVPNVFTPDGSPGYNDNFEISFGTDMIAPADLDLPVRLIVVDRWGKTVYESADYQNNWNGADLAAGVYYVHLRVGDLVTCKNWVHIVK